MSTVHSPNYGHHCNPRLQFQGGDPIKECGFMATKQRCPPQTKTRDHSPELIGAQYVYLENNSSNTICSRVSIIHDTHHTLPSHKTNSHKAAFSSLLSRARVGVLLTSINRGSSVSLCNLWRLSHWVNLVERS